MSSETRQYLYTAPSAGGAYKKLGDHKIETYGEKSGPSGTERPEFLRTFVHGPLSSAKTKWNTGARFGGQVHTMSRARFGGQVQTMNRQIAGHVNF